MTAGTSVVCKVRDPVSTTTTLIVHGQGYTYKATVNDEVVVSGEFGADEAGLHAHPLSPCLLEGENIIRVGGTPAKEGASLQVVLGTGQVGGQPRALIEETFAESFGVSATLDLAVGDGLPRQEPPLGADPRQAQELVMELHDAIHQRDAARITALLQPVAQFWSLRDNTEPSWEASDYFKHLRAFVDDSSYRVRPLKTLDFRAVAGGRLQVPLQDDASAITFEHALEPQSAFEFQVAVAPSPDGWTFVR